MVTALLVSTVIEASASPTDTRPPPLLADVAETLALAVPPTWMSCAVRRAPAPTSRSPSGVEDALTSESLTAHQAAAGTARRGGDDSIAGRRAGKCPGSADALEDLRAAAVGGDVDDQPMLAAARIREIDALFAERAGAGEDRARDGGPAGSDATSIAAGRIEQPEAVRIDPVDVIGDAVDQAADRLIRHFAQAVDVVLIGRQGGRRERQRSDGDLWRSGGSA